MNPPTPPSTELSAQPETDVVIVAVRKPTAAIDRYALLRLQQLPSVQGGHLIDFLAERSRTKCDSMSSQF